MMAQLNVALHPNDGLLDSTACIVVAVDCQKDLHTQGILYVCGENF
jgi:hypothetical protein